MFLLSNECVVRSDTVLLAKGYFHVCLQSSFRVRVKRDEASLCGGRVENGFAQAICNDFITKNRPSGGCEIEGEWGEKVELNGCF